MRREDDISPYLKRPLRSLDEVLRQRGVRRGAIEPPPAANSDQPPPAKSA
jgi:hypothetical protein